MEIALINKELFENTVNLSNLDKTIDKAVDIACNTLKLWDLSGFKEKETLQYMLFPEGVFYNTKKMAFKAERVNSIFELMSCISTGLQKKKERTKPVVLVSLR
jgi:hypothetical protein